MRVVQVCVVRAYPQVNFDPPILFEPEHFLNSTYMYVHFYVCKFLVFRSPCHVLISAVHERRAEMYIFLIVDPPYNSNGVFSPFHLPHCGSS